MDEDYRVKIADATLSRDIYELDYYKPGEKAKALPVKWMSPEALEHDLFTCKGDVVSSKLTIIYILLERETFIYFRFCIIFIKVNNLYLQWSFGVVMWEIFTLAATPYPEIPNSDMRNHMRTGVRLEKPETTPVAL